MKIYTSYYGMLKKIPSNIMPISISRRKPEGCTISSFPFLAPSATLLSKYKKSGSKTEYVTEFNLYLDTLNCNAIYGMLRTVSKDQDIVLLCYEKPDDFCHRHLVAGWFNKHGYEATEFFVHK